MANTPSTVWPVNELGEIVFDEGQGSNYVTGFVSDGFVPTTTSGKVAAVMRNKPTGSLPMVMIGGDHAYRAWYGNKGDDGMMAAYQNYGIKPYIAICTDPLTGAAPTGDGCLSWQQLLQIKNAGAEIHAHGVKHPAIWEQISTGIAVWYTGNDSSATGQVTYTNVGAQPVPANVQLVSSSNNDNITLPVASYPTLELLAAAINATGKWGCEVDTSLPAGTPSAYLLGHVSPITLTKLPFTAVGFSVGGGAILLRYEGTAYKRMVISRPYNSNNITLYGDGVQLANWNALTQTTLSSLVSAINSLGVSGLTANLCTNGNLSNWTSRSYNSLTGNESTLCLKFFENLELGQRTVSLDSCYMSRSKVIQNQQETCAATAASNGVELKGFIQSGSNYFPWTIPGASKFISHRCSPNLISVGPVMGISRTSKQPNAHIHQNINSPRILCYYSGVGTATIELDAKGFLNGVVTGAPNSFSFDLKQPAYATIKQVIDAVSAVSGWSATAFGLSTQASPNHDSSSVLFRGASPYNAKNTIGYNGAPISASVVGLQRERAALDALVDSKGFYINRLIHSIYADGSSKFTGLTAGAIAPEYGDCSEYTFNGALSYIQKLVQAGKIQQVTPYEFALARQSAPAPDNYVFNPHFVSSGETLLVDESNQTRVPSGAGARIPGWVTSGASSNIASMTAQDGVLTITTTSNASINPVTQYITLERGKEYEMGMDVEMVGVSSGGYLRLQIVKSRKLLPLNSPRETAGTEGFLSHAVYGNQTVVQRFFIDDDNANPLGQIIGNVAEPFNLSTNKQISLNIDNVGVISNIDCSSGAVSNTAVTAAEVAAAINAAIKASGTYPAEFWNAASAVAGKVVITSPYRRTVDTVFAVQVTAGTADAQTAIFGSNNNKAYSPNIKRASAVDFPYQLTVAVAAQGTIKLSNVYIKEVKENV
jgi:hypothetical protein